MLAENFIASDNYLDLLKFNSTNIPSVLTLNSIVFTSLVGISSLTYIIDYPDRDNVYKYYKLVLQISICLQSYNLFKT